MPRGTIVRSTKPRAGPSSFGPWPAGSTYYGVVLRGQLLLRSGQLSPTGMSYRTKMSLSRCSPGAASLKMQRKYMLRFPEQDLPH